MDDSRPTYFEELFAALNDRGVRYVVVGGLAAVLHGVSRLTNDADLLPELAEDNLLALAEVLSRLGYVARAPVPLAAMADPAARQAWRDERGLIAFSVYHVEKPYQVIDVILFSAFSFAEVKRDAVIMGFGEVTIPVAGLARLIEMKRRAGRPHDLADVRLLERLRDE